MAKMSQTIATSNLQFAIVDGANADTDITVTALNGTSLAYGDVLVCVMEMAVTTNAWTDQTANCSIQSDGKLQCTNSTASDRLFVLWEAATNALGYASFCIKSGIDLSVSAGQDTFDIAGIEAGDPVILCVGIDGTTGAMQDVTKWAICSNDGEVEISTWTDSDEGPSPLTFDDDVFCLYYDMNAGGTGNLSDLADTGHCLQPVVVSGAGADTNIAITGIVTDDRLVCVLELDGTDYNIVADRTSTSSITSDGNIQCTASTSGNKLFVLWNDTSA